MFLKSFLGFPKWPFLRFYQRNTKQWRHSTFSSLASARFASLLRRPSGLGSGAFSGSEKDMKGKRFEVGNREA